MLNSHQRVGQTHPCCITYRMVLGTWVAATQAACRGSVLAITYLKALLGQSGRLCVYTCIHGQRGQGGAVHQQHGSTSNHRLALQQQHLSGVKGLNLQHDTAQQLTTSIAIR